MENYCNTDALIYIDSSKNLSSIVKHILVFINKTQQAKPVLERLMIEKASIFSWYPDRVIILDHLLLMIWSNIKPQATFLTAIYQTNLKTN